MAVHTVQSPYGAAQFQAQFNAATEDGAVVECPATGGAVGWTAGAVWNAPANATLRGAGTAATGGGDQTVIQDDFNSASPLIQLNLAATGVFRMIGITVQSGTSATTKTGGTTQINTGGSKLAIEYCHFIDTDYPRHQTIRFGAGVFGVMAECILDFQEENSLFFYNGRDNGTGGGQGNYEWTLPAGFGSENFFFIEDCEINGSIGGASTYSTRVFDGYTAARVVVRFNNVSQAVLAEDHATGHAFDDRGPRAVEVYGNAVTSSLVSNPNFTAVDLKNGTKRIWGNTWNNVYKNIYYSDVTRRNNGTYSQSATPTGWGYAGTEFNGTGSNWDGGTYNGTDTTLGYPCLDQPGRGAGQLLTGSQPTKINSVTGILSWPNQALEPIYLWNNTGGVVSGWGGTVNANNSAGRVVADRDYYLPASGVQTSPTSPFNGTTGCGWGTLANRPTTCTTGVAYFATDQGSWNQTASNPNFGVNMNGASGVLYIATATDTWTESYVPYTYPHPLRGETGAILDVTTMNVSVVNGPA